VLSWDGHRHPQGIHFKGMNKSFELPGNRCLSVNSPPSQNVAVQGFWPQIAYQSAAAPHACIGLDSVLVRRRRPLECLRIWGKCHEEGLG
jgi:hypothetical protein